MTMTLPRISVALCTYNGARYLKEQLDSMLIQTRLPDELVACDDGSKDATLDILEEFKRTAPFPVRVIRNEQNLKMAKNFEKCIGLCTGEFIAPCDFDDAWYPNKLEVLLATIEANKEAGYITADADLMDESSNSVEGTLFGREAYRYLPKPEFPFEIRESTLLKKNVVWGSSMLIRAEIRHLVLPLPGRWTQDAGIALLSCFAGRYGKAIADRLMRYRLHSTQAFGVQPPIWKLIPVLRSAPREVWAEEARLYSDLKNYVCSKPELLSASSAQILQLLDDKITHLRNRDLARSSRGLRRWKIVMLEMISGRYQKFSLSWNSFGRDLLL